MEIRQIIINDNKDLDYCNERLKNYKSYIANANNRDDIIVNYSVVNIIDEMKLCDDYIWVDDLFVREKCSENFSGCILFYIGDSCYGACYEGKNGYWDSFGRISYNDWVVRGILD